MNGAERKKEILRILSQQESVDVEELTKLFGVSKVTVRADLDALEAKGLLIRTHGGALSAENKNSPIPLVRRLKRRKGLLKAPPLSFPTDLP